MSRALQNGISGRRLGNSGRYVQSDILGFLNLVQLKCPLLRLSLKSLLSSLFEFSFHILVGGGNEPLSNLIPLVQPVCTTHGPRFSVQRMEGIVDDLWLLVHKLLDDSTTARLGIGELVDAFENRSPGSTLVVRFMDGGAVAEP